MTIEQLTVFLENSTGKMVEVLEALAGAGVDLRALSLADTESFGILRMIVDKPGLARSILQNEGYGVELTGVIPVSVDDKPGAFASALRVLADAGVGVEYAYVFVAPKYASSGKAYAILCVDDNNAAIEALAEGGVGVVSSAEMFDGLSKTVAN